MEHGAEKRSSAQEDGQEFRKAVCQGIREDGANIEAGENDNLIVQKLEANPAAFGMFGFSFLDQNADKIKGGAVEGVPPTFENISARSTRFRARCSST